MRPYPAAAIVLPKIWHPRSVPVRLVSITRDQSASSTSSVGPFCVIPAAFTRMSTLPNWASTASCSACTCARSATSLTTRSVRRPSPSISAATASTAEDRRELATTSAPASANPSAIAWPSPVVPPVTTATLPLKSNRPRLIDQNSLWPGQPGPMNSQNSQQIRRGAKETPALAYSSRPIFTLWGEATNHPPQGDRFQPETLSRSTHKSEPPRRAHPQLRPMQ